MKNKLNIFTLIIFTLLTLSCSHDEDNSATSQPTDDYFFKAKVDGVQYTKTGFQVGASLKTNGGILIASLGGESFQIHVDNVATTGTYPTTSLAGNPISRMAVTYGNPAVIYQTGDCGTSGVLIITSISSTEVTGTFSFTGTTIGGACPRPIKTITEGSFKSKIN